MNSRNSGLTIFGVLLYAAGVLIGMLLFGSSVWADFEAMFFAPATGARSTLSGYSCPMMLAHHEVGEISLKITNLTDGDVRRRVRFYSTDGFVTLLREEMIMYDVPANSSIDVGWTVFPQDAAYKRFLLVRAHLFPLWPEPSETASCGILVFSLGRLSGVQIVSLAVVLSGLFIGLGLFLWTRTNPTQGGGALSLTNAMRALALLVFGGIVTSIFSNWLIGAFLLLLTFFLIVIVIGLALSTN